MERTLAILKPDCTKKKLSGEVITRIENAGFAILGMKVVRLTNATAGEFYAVHKEKPFYNDLVKFTCSGTSIPIALEKENAVADFRKLIGATDPKDAEPGTIRRDFASSMQENIVHGSDSVESGRFEVRYFFSEKELTGEFVTCS
ncbi:MAG: nucleoside-diphosphate kinase [Ignavibacteria bacterium]|nr:nucleoside-diphosphate kinase [Ignavibacteria bacterium]